MIRPGLDSASDRREIIVVDGRPPRHCSRRGRVRTLRSSSGHTPARPWARGALRHALSAVRKNVSTAVRSCGLNATCASRNRLRSRAGRVRGPASAEPTVGPGGRAASPPRSSTWGAGVIPVSLDRPDRSCAPLLDPAGSVEAFRDGQPSRAAPGHAPTLISPWFGGHDEVVTSLPRTAQTESS